MNSKFQVAIIAGLKVAAHIFVAAGLSAVLAWLAHDPRFIAAYPVINVLQVIVLKYVQQFQQ